MSSIVIWVADAFISILYGTLIGFLIHKSTGDIDLATAAGLMVFIIVYHLASLNSKGI